MNNINNCIFETATRYLNSEPEFLSELLRERVVHRNKEYIRYNIPFIKEDLQCYFFENI